MLDLWDFGFLERQLTFFYICISSTHLNLTYWSCIPERQCSCIKNNSQRNITKFCRYVEFSYVHLSSILAFCWLSGLQIELLDSHALALPLCTLCISILALSNGSYSCCILAVSSRVCHIVSYDLGYKQGFKNIECTDLPLALKWVIAYTMQSSLSFLIASVKATLCTDQRRTHPTSCSPLPSLISAVDCICLVSC